MPQLTYITSNLHKAEQMSRFLGYPIQPTSVAIPEIQSLNLEEVITHKTKAAFALLQTPLVVDDVSLVIHAMNKLPGPFIKYFEQEIGNKKLCQIIDLYPLRTASAYAVLGYHDGKNVHLFEGKIEGVIAKEPSGTGGFGWDEIFIPEGHTKIRSEMNVAEYDETSPRRVALDKLAAFLQEEKLI